MDLIQFLVEIIFQSFTVAQIWKKQPFLSSLFRWIIVHYLCYTLMWGCFHPDRYSAICKHILETVFAKSLLDSWGGSRMGEEEEGGLDDEPSANGECDFQKKTSTESLPM